VRPRLPLCWAVASILRTMPGTSDLEHDLEQLCLWAARTPLIVRLWLYGSRARGDHRDDSDLDIAVENLTAPTDTDPLTTAVFELEGWRRELQPILKLRLHLESIHESYDVIQPAVLEHGRLVYEALRHE
jgi:predicted nucleotidyltransferase